MLPSVKRVGDIYRRGVAGGVCWWEVVVFILACAICVGVVMVDLEVGVGEGHGVAAGGRGGEIVVVGSWLEMLL